MSALKVSIVSGNPQPGSRTVAAARRLAEKLGDSDPHTLELSEIASEVFDFSSTKVLDAKHRVLDADVVVVATPTYKASFTGLLKAFLDHYGAGDLAGVFAVPLMTIGSDRHYLAAETQLRPVLVELGATVATAAFPVATSQLDHLDDLIEEWMTSNAHGIAAMNLMARNLSAGD
ncbi:NADPH-dependent FMN reductase [Mycolicibacterium confluentis]|uniref:FMN reductase n=1 Tax=Mycolicibacterium confluentis TaxID=28047 RepID=A0A7I7XWL4_9MYCO|nr:NAD(P)H-dependent oxidoreductase [Mycolicibacterium confluentis]MCV7321873.1 NAD(P)H-dependent oxidoreductase [Mycolicibacterium confluentis]ORV32127.1 hypothetical protein AWB99_10750 [Mycolicibacterium confluentis]BBZ33690.1 FMN reductase [Mycolicibacterium confluentis]